MSQKKYLEYFGSKTVWQVARLIFDNPQMAFGITEIARNAGTSRSNVYRALGRLEELGLVRTIKSGKKKLYQAETSHPFSMPVWELVAAEKYMNIKPEFKNALDLFTSRIDRDKVHTLILFGSVARGLAEKWSDVDLLTVVRGDETAEIMKSLAKEMFPDYRFELHFYSPREFYGLDDFVVLDAILSGIPLLGMRYVFDVKKELRSFPRSYLIYRLNEAKKLNDRMKTVEGDAREYFQRILTTSLAEIISLMERRTTLPKALVEEDMDVEEEIERLETEISQVGDRIWLT